MIETTPGLMGLLVATPFMIATGQLLFKMTSNKLVEAGGGFQSVFFNPVFVSAIIMYGLATLLWIFVLKTVPLSYAYSFMALTFILVPILAAVFLGETLTLRYAIGTAFVMFGLVIVQSS